MTRKESHTLHWLAIPSIISGLSDPIVALSDTYFVNSFGPNTLAAVGLGSALFMTLLWLLNALKNTLSAHIAHHVGAQNRAKANYESMNGLSVGLLISVLSAMLAFYAQDFLLGLYSPSTSVAALAKQYFSIRLIGLPFIAGSYLIFGILKGYQNTQIAMWGTLACGLLNILLNYMLIEGGFGFPLALGIKGAAWASCTSQIALFLFSLYVVQRYSPLRFFINIKHSLKILSDSTQLFLRTLFLNITLFFGNKIAAGVPLTLATHSIFIQLWLFSSYFIDGYANAALALTGRYSGARDWKRLLYNTHLTIKINALFGFIIGTTLYFFSTPIIGFLAADAEITLIASQNSIWLCVSIFVGTLAFSMDGVLIGLKKMSFLRNNLFIATFLLFLPAVYLLLSLDVFELTAIWGSLLVWLLFRGIVPYYYLRNQIKNH